MPPIPQSSGPESVGYTDPVPPGYTPAQPVRPGSPGISGHPSVHTQPPTGPIPPVNPSGEAGGGAPSFHFYQSGQPHPSQSGLSPFKTVRKKSMWPFYLAGIYWVCYGIWFPLYRWRDFLTVAIGSVIVFIVSRLLIADKTVVIRLTPQEMLERQRQMEQEILAQKKAEAEAAASAEIPPEAQAYLEQIRQADVAIEDPAVSQKIGALEERTRHIFQVVAEKPEKQPDIRRFMNYYLPTLLKLLHSYDRMEEQEVKGANIRYTMQEIERILDTILEAFDKQFDLLFEDEAMDISSDIRVLETIFSQEGLVQPGSATGLESDSKPS